MEGNPERSLSLPEQSADAAFWKQAEPQAPKRVGKSGPAEAPRLQRNVLNPANAQRATPAAPPADISLGAATRAYVGLVAALTANAAAGLSGRARGRLAQTFSGAKPSFAQLGGGVVRLKDGARRLGAAGARVVHRWPRFRLRYALALIGLAALGVFGYLAYCVATLPINGGLQAEAAQSALVIEADNGEAFATRGAFRGDKLTAADLPPHLAQAIVAIEDRRFYQHRGVDLRGLARAVFRNAQAGGTREGGSTITQQLARLMFLSQERTLKRKVQEAMLALWLESQLSKDEILVRYLNTAFYGAGAYGADAAAKRYFGKRAKELSLGEAAMLAGLVRAPSQLAPTRSLGGAKERADTVLQAMADTGAITPQQADQARAQPVSLQTPPETPPGSNYFVDMVANDVRRLLGSPAT